MNRGIRTLCLLLLAAGLLAGCAAPEQDPGPQIDLEAEAEAVKVRSMEWLAWAQMKDYASIAGNIFTANAETIFDGKYLVGPAAIQSDMEQDAAKSPDGVVTWVTSKVEVAASGDLAYERGSWEFDPDGVGEAPAEEGQYLTVWKKVDGVWRCIVDAGTTLKTEPEASE